MTIPQPTPPSPYPAEETGYPAPTVGRPGRSLAAAIAVFLGGYLLLASFAGQLGMVSWSIVAGITGRPSPDIPAATAMLLVLQFLFAIVVVVAGLILANGSAVGRLIGAILVLVGSLLTFTFIGLRISGFPLFPGGREGIPFQAVFHNSWFAIVLVVGVAWLLARRAKLGWLSLLGTLVLIPVPTAFVYAGVESGVVQIVMFLLSGIVGAGIILAGRPWRD